jgi:hypothetical protein
MVKSKPLQCKKLLIRSHCSGRVWKQIWAYPKGRAATGGELFAILARTLKTATVTTISYGRTSLAEEEIHLQTMVVLGYRRSRYLHYYRLSK